MVLQGAGSHKAQELFHDGAPSCQVRCTQPTSAEKCNVNYAGRSKITCCKEPISTAYRPGSKDYTEASATNTYQPAENVSSSALVPTTSFEKQNSFTCRFSVAHGLWYFEKTHSKCQVQFAEVSNHSQMAKALQSNGDATFAKSNHAKIKQHIELEPKESPPT